MIPKIVHYCWFGKSAMPEISKKCLESWKLVLPEWTFIEWNETNSPIKNSYVRNALAKKKYAFASDYVRFHALFQHGGIYLDTDVEVIKSFETLLKHDFFIGQESKLFINAAVVGSIPNHEFISGILTKINSHEGVDYQTIPKIITPFLALQDFDQIKNVLFDCEYFYPYNPFDPDRNAVKQMFYSDITANTYAIHHWQQSWQFSIWERVVKK